MGENLFSLFSYTVSNIKCEFHDIFAWIESDGLKSESESFRLRLNRSQPGIVRKSSLTFIPMKDVEYVMDYVRCFSVDVLV